MEWRGGGGGGEEREGEVREREKEGTWEGDRRGREAVGYGAYTPGLGCKQKLPM